MKIVVLDGYLLGFGGRSWEPIARHGEFAYHDMTTAQDDVAAVIGNADAVYTNRCPVSAETIGRCPNLKMICSFGTGYNQIDLDAANRRGIVVCNIPSYGRGAVAQMAAALLFAMSATFRPSSLCQNGGCTSRMTPRSARSARWS